MEDKAKIWLDYIAKLNDRYHDELKTSGLTTWSVLALVTVLAYNVLNNVSTIYNRFDLFIDWTANSANLLICIFLITISFLMRIDVCPSKRRMNNLFSKLINGVMLYPLAFLCVVFALVNYTTARNAQLHFRWPYYIFIAYYGIQIIIPFINSIFMKSAVKKSPGFPGLTSIGNARVKDVSFYFSATLLLTAFLFSLGNYPGMFYVHNMTVLILAFKSALILVLLLCLMYVQVAREEHYWLLDLERDIIVEELSDAAIKERFIREYLGEEMSNWLQRHVNAIFLKHTEFQQLVTEFKEITDNETISNDIIRKAIAITNQMMNKRKEYLTAIATLTQDTRLISVQSGSDITVHPMLRIANYVIPKQLMEIDQEFTAALSKVQTMQESRST